MIKYKEITREIIEEVVDKIICDVCKEEFDDETQYMDTQEFQHIVFIGGYSSAFGDCNEIELDICSTCLETTFRGCYRVVGNVLTDPEEQLISAEEFLKELEEDYQGDGDGDDEVRQEDDGDGSPLG